MGRKLLPLKTFMPIFQSLSCNKKKSIIGLGLNDSVTKAIRAHLLSCGSTCLMVPGIAIALLVIGTLSSCNIFKNQVYFKDLPRDTTLRNIITENYDLKIRKGDLIAITVASPSPDVEYFNGLQNPGKEQPGGYLVDENGNIDFVKLGILHVEGLRTKQLKDTLENLLIPYLKNSVVSLQFLNRHVTMLGAVSSQLLPLTGGMTILDAIAASGDIGLKGKMDNVLVIRDENGTKVFKRLNLKDHTIFYSTYYYLRPNDIIYVEPMRIKTQLSVAEVLSYVTTGLSLFFILTKL
jgi:polysaccharide export outer membrane protein